jgi:hypothetical protein
MRLAALLLLALAGCATPPPVLSPQQAQQIPTAELCLGASTYRPENAQTAMNELNRRGVNCQDHAQGIQELQQRRAAALQYIMSRPAYKPYQLPMPPQQQNTNCTGQWIGNQWHTTCR